MSRVALAAVWAACAACTATGGATASLTTGAAGGTMHFDVTTSVNDTPGQAPPADVDQHLHETPTYTADVDKLYVEITSDDEHAELLRQSATAGLASTSYVVAVSDGGDIELHMEVASLDEVPDGVTCKLKIFVLRMPQHDLLAIADGGAHVTTRTATEDCLSATGTAIVRDKLPLIFHKQLEAKQ